MNKKRKYIDVKALLLVLVIMIFGFNIQSDDKELFMAANLGTERVRPNVVIIMDNSGSMNTIIFYPKDGLDRIAGTADDGYDPLTYYSGSVDGFTSSTNYVSSTAWHARWIVNGYAQEYDTTELNGIDGKNWWTGCYANDGTPNNFQHGGNGTSYFAEGDTVIYRSTGGTGNDARAVIKRKYTASDSTPWFELEDIEGGPIEVGNGHFQKSPDGRDWAPTIIQLYGTSESGNNVRYPRDYLEWAYIHSSEDHRQAISHFSTYGTFDVNYSPAPELSNCATPGNNDLGGTNPRIKVTFTRIQTAREVICRVASTSNTIVKLGLFKFTTEIGSTIVEGLNDMSDESSELVAYKNSVWGINATTWTPLAEAMADVWFYYKPGPASKTYWPSDYEIDNNTVTHSVSNPVTPIDYWCQNNYIVLMTDGESTMDRFDHTKYSGSVFRDKPVKRTYPWNDWNDGWGDSDNNDDKNYGYLPANYNPSGTYCPNYSCWYASSGSDLLDDMSYFIRNQDMFPDSHYGSDPDTGWPGDQKIYTYTIGFTADNDMLLQTAINGEGAYYTANNYDELVEAFQLVLTSINLRNFAFSAITAPKKTSTATNADQTVSYVGYFMPSQAASIWEGHLLAFELEDSWGFDTDNSGSVESEEFVYPDEQTCLNNSGGNACQRWVALAIGHEWDAADKVPLNRNLQTHNETSTLIPFTEANAATIQPLIDASITTAEAQQIIAHINEPRFGDVFHSDVGFVGPPPFGKQFLPNIDPPGDTDQKYADYYTANENRQRVIYTGTNDGILHMLYADGIDAGKEIWGFLPDETLPSLKTIVLDNKHTYTVDGRLAAGDIWWERAGGSTKQWGTILVFGLRSGGNTYYCMDITDVDNSPNMLWKFEDPVHSGQSWGKATIGRLKVADSGGDVEDKWVVFLTGGYGFNSENPNDHKGKSIFVLDAATGEQIYALAYDPTSGATSTGPGLGSQEEVAFTHSTNNKYLTQSSLFNYSIPSSLTAIDRDNDGYTDSIYFGNMAGHLFKTDISNNDRDEWKTFAVYKNNYIVDKDSEVIDSILDDVFTLNRAAFELGDGIMGKTSYATGYITGIDKKDITVVTTSGAFQAGEEIVCRTYDPIFLSPAIAFDTCYQLWVTFGTGDRDRPRTNVREGRYVGIKDNGTTNYIEDSSGNDSMATLQDVSFGATADEVPDTQLSDAYNGWYMLFTDTGEKLFDPEPVILPDENLIPHIYFNTYQPPPETISNTDNPCSAPQEGTMKIYDISLESCGTTEVIAGEKATGRIAGGGIYQGKEYVIYKSESGDVADVPGGEGGNFVAEPKRLPYAGGILFWKEKKR